MFREEDNECCQVNAASMVVDDPTIELQQRGFYSPMEPSQKKNEKKAKGAVFYGVRTAGPARSLLTLTPPSPVSAGLFR